MNGTVGVLNVGAGDTKLSFDKSNPAERIRAARIVKDMLRRGYALLIEVERDGRKVFTRATDFDEEVCEYIIADFDPLGLERQPETPEPPQPLVTLREETPHASQQETPPQEPPPPAPRRGRPPGKRVPAEGARAVAVARTAGG